MQNVGPPLAKGRIDSLEWNRVEEKNVKKLVSNLDCLRLS